MDSSNARPWQHNPSAQIRGRLVAVVAALAILALGCGPQFREVSAKEFQEEWNLLSRDSAVSWWYAGERDGCYYFVTRYPQDIGIKRQFRVRREAIRLVDVPTLEFTQDSSRWFNVKLRNVSLEPQAAFPAR